MKEKNIICENFFNYSSNCKRNTIKSIKQYLRPLKIQLYNLYYISFLYNGKIKLTLKV